MQFQCLLTWLMHRRSYSDSNFAGVLTEYSSYQVALMTTGAFS